MENSQPGRNGGRLRTGGKPGNSGGKKGRSGRPPRAWKAFCKDTIEDPVVQDGIRKRAIKGEPAIVRVLADHGIGMPEQPIRLTGSDALEQLLSRLAGLAAAERAAQPPGGPDGEGA